MVRMAKTWGLLAMLTCGACSAAQQQAAEPVAEESGYVDPWGTQVAWSSVPAPSSGATASAAPAETEEAKPKAEEETPKVEPEAEAATSTGDLGGDEDSDD